MLRVRARGRRDTVKRVSLVNLQAREISIKVVYYGPGLGGKTSSLQFIHRALKPESRGQLVSLATGIDRTLYFDFLPVKLPKLRGFNVRVQLYTVPGQVHYNSTRKLVLNGCDGVVFVADSQKEREAANIESMENLRDNLKEQGLALGKLPVVFQYNKRDCPSLLTRAQLDGALNPSRVQAFETVATTGKGVFDALKAITTDVLQDLRAKGAWEPPPRDRAEDKKSAGGAAGKRDTAAPSTASSGSLSEKIIEFAERSDPAIRVSGSGARTLPAPPTGSLAELLAPGPVRSLVLEVEGDIVRGDYAGAVRRVGKHLEDAVAELAGPDREGGSAVVALLYRLPGDRYLRLRELLRRVDTGAVSSQDAVFGLFFLVDLELARAAAATARV